MAEDVVAVAVAHPLDGEVPLEEVGVAEEVVLQVEEDQAAVEVEEDFHLVAEAEEDSRGEDGDANSFACMWYVAFRKGKIETRVQANLCTKEYFHLYTIKNI